MKNRLVLACIFVVSLLSLTVNTAYAHFAIRDGNTGAQAIFHAAPDDDPIAGEESILSYDFGDQGLQTNKFDYVLSIRSDTKKTEEVPIKHLGSAVFAKYTFPQQGLYNITLDIKPKNNSEKTSKLTYIQRISRGDLYAKAFPQWTRTALTIAAFALLVILIIVFNRREDIIKLSKSKFKREKR